MNVGWIGLGNMGSAMASNLMKAGHQLTIYNRTRSRAEALQAEGAKVADSPAEAADAPLLVTMLADDHALEQIIFGSGKVLEVLAPGSTHICMSTISVALAKRLAEAHRKAGQSYISAPVLGRPEAAAAAKLFVLVAGPGDVARQCQPLFDAIGQRTYRMGEDAFLANVIKLSANFLIASVIENLGEAFALVRKYGIAPQQYFEFLTTSLFDAPLYKTYGTLIAQDRYEPAGFKMPLGLKDIRLTLAAAESAGVPLPVASFIHDQMVTAIGRGGAESDWSSIARLAAENAGLKPSS
jgi:3-hydroxyisobutyrate dehydrogenase-like beta-hydroxyacid dehydrogenase